jgi:hypothetical protein
MTCGPGSHIGRSGADLLRRITVRRNASAWCPPRWSAKQLPGPSWRDSSAPLRHDKARRSGAERVTAGGDTGCDLRELSGSRQFPFRLSGYRW